MASSWPIVFMGTPETAAATLELLIAGPDPVVGVVTQPDRPAGRGQQTISTPVRRVAERHEIPVLAPAKLRDPAFVEALAAWKPKVVTVVAYGRILPRAVLDLPPRGCLNVHYSLLPKYRGAAPVAWTIINGEEKGGVTTMRLVEKMDAGPILLQEEMPVAPGDTTGALQARLTPLGARLLLETLRGLREGSLDPRAQNEAEATFAPMLKKEDGLIDWGRPAVLIERRIRGMNPWPSAYTHLRGKLLKIHRARVVSPDRKATAGEIIRADGGGFWVAAGDGALDLEEVQLENKKRLPGAEFLKGARIKAGDRL